MIIAILRKTKYTLVQFKIVFPFQTNPKSFRNLRKPISVQDPEKEERYINNYRALSDELSRSHEMSCPSVGPFHYGSHYSNTGNKIERKLAWFENKEFWSSTHIARSISWWRLRITLGSRYPYYRYQGRLTYLYSESTDNWVSANGESCKGVPVTLLVRIPGPQCNCVSLL